MPAWVDSLETCYTAYLSTANIRPSKESRFSPHSLTQTFQTDLTNISTKLPAQTAPLAAVRLHLQAERHFTRLTPRRALMCKYGPFCEKVRTPPRKRQMHSLWPLSPLVICIDLLSRSASSIFKRLSPPDLQVNVSPLSLDRRTSCSRHRWSTFVQFPSHFRSTARRHTATSSQRWLSEVQHTKHSKATACLS